MNADLLQSYEHVLETFGRLVTVTQRLIDAQQRSETIAPSVLEDYAGELWKTIGDQRAH